MLSLIKKLFAKKEESIDAPWPFPTGTAPATVTEPVAQTPEPVVETATEPVVETPAEPVAKPKKAAKPKVAAKTTARKPRAKKAQ
jgi:hypothetical protein